MNTAPLISVIMPAYNAAAYIADGIRSILAQEHRPIEVIVVDDGSTDETASIADGFGEPVRCYTQKNAGPSSARNTGLSKARGDYIAFLDADDVYEPHKLQLQLEKLRDNLEVDIVIGRLVREQLVPGTGKLPVFSPIPRDERIFLSLGTILARRTVFTKVGMLDEELLAAEDLDWFKRAQEMGIEHLLHEDIVLRQRKHHTNITRDRKALKHNLARMLKRSIERRDAPGGTAPLSAPSSPHEPSGHTGKKSEP